TPFTCGGFRKLLPPIGAPLPARTRRKAFDGRCCDTRSITKHPHASKTRLCCGHGSAKRPGLRSNGSRRFCGEAMASYCQRLERSGVRSMRKPAAPAAYLSRCGSSFRFERAVVLVLVVLVPYTAVATGERGGDRRGEQRKLNIERRALSVGP